ncbi:MAG: VaFE repeat-containing surface-anchored protein [Mobiluncus sp.]|uniref:VaFE repeat-containing surface-anchored protein n=1 Tax=Mobiluncus sp. TaxID=47293 RepID=UPI0025887D88|nr:VaFE repeat-containing surface-anchored protein [Mobiluncus sp.]MCI6585215.1 VaFE repeat-containing surface-anchored protein [Mobiluncus sp.]
MDNMTRKPRESRPAASGLTKVGFKKKTRNWAAGAVAVGVAIAWTIGGLVMPSMAADASAQLVEKPSFTTVVGTTQTGDWKVISSGIASKIVRFGQTRGDSSAETSSTYLDTVPLEKSSDGQLAKYGRIVYKATSCWGFSTRNTTDGLNYKTTCWYPTRFVGTCEETADANGTDRSANDPEETELRRAPGLSEEAENSLEEETNGDAPEATLSDSTPDEVEESAPSAGESGLQSSEDTASDASETGATQALIFPTKTGDSCQSYNNISELPVNELNANDWQILGYEEMGTPMWSPTTETNGTNGLPITVPGVFLEVNGKGTMVGYFTNAGNYTITSSASENQLFKKNGLVRVMLAQVNTTATGGKFTLTASDGTEYPALCIEPDNTSVPKEGNPINISGAGFGSFDVGTAHELELANVVDLYNKNKALFGQSAYTQLGTLQWFVWYISSGYNVTYFKDRYNPDQSKIAEIQAELQKRQSEKVKTISDMLKALQLKTVAAYTTSDNTANVYKVVLEGYDTFHGDLANLQVTMTPQANSGVTISYYKDEKLTQQVTNPTLEELSKGLYIKFDYANGVCTGSDPSTLKIGFVGDALIPGLTMKYKHYQAQIILDGVPVNVSGELTVSGGACPQPSNPSIGTTAKVNGLESNLGQAETATLTPGASVTLTDDVKYENLKPNTPYTLTSTLTHLSSNGEQRGVELATANVMSDQDGTDVWQGLFSKELNYADVNEGDKFYYEEVLKDPTTGAIIASHNGINPDQTVIIKKTQPQATLVLEKVGAGAAASAQGNVTFTVTCGEGATKTLYAPARGGVANEIPTLAGVSQTVLNVTPGEVCEVVETYTSSTVVPQSTGSNYTPFTVTDTTTNTSIPVASGRTAQFSTRSEAGTSTLTANYPFVVPANGGRVKVVATNNYNDLTGGFKVTKTVEGIDKDQAAAANPNQTFQFTYSCADSQEGGVFWLPNNGSWTYEVDGLKVGTQCTITETSPTAPAGYNVTVSAASSNGSNSQNGTITVGAIEANKIAGVTFLNYYQPSNASFSIKKIAKYSDSGEAITGNFNFTYNCGQGDQKVTVPANGEAVPVTANIKAGQHCTVKELSADRSDPANTTFEGVTFKTGNSAPVKDEYSFDVPKDGTVLVIEATNTYKHKQGYFTLTKSFNVDENPLKDKAFTFTVKCGDAPEQTVSLHGIDDPKTTNVRENAKTFGPYNLGTTCKVTETNPSTPSAVDKVTWQGGQPVAGDAWSRTVTINTESTASSPALTLNATNNVSAQYGKISLKKTMTGSAAANQKSIDATYPIDLKCDTGDNPNVVNLKGNGEVWTSPSNTMVVGSKCILHEDLSKVSIDGITPTLVAVNGATPVTGKPGYYEVTVPAKDAPPVEVVFNNSMEYQKASFKVMKYVTSSQEVTFSPNEFRFTYTCKSPLGDFTNANNPLYAGVTNPFKDYIKVFVNGSGTSLTAESPAVEVPAGSTCSVTEIDPKTYNQTLIQSPKVNPVSYEKTTFQPAGTAMTSGEQTISEGSTFYFAATNNYVDKVAGFQFNKVFNPDTEVSNNNAAWEKNTFNFGWSCQKPDGSKVNGSAPMTITSPVELSPNLAVGTKCVIWEESVAPHANETTSTKWLVDGSEAPGAKVTDFAGNEHANGYAFTINESQARLAITAQNTFSVPYTSLTLDKKLVRGENVSVDPNKVFDFEVSCDYTTGGTHSTQVQLKDTDPVKTIDTFDGVKIPVGSTCRVNEANANVANHTWILKLTKDGQTISNGAAFTLDKTTPIAVVAENTYTRDLGKFSIVKTVSGEGNLVKQPSYDFDYTCTGDGEPVTGEILGVVENSSVAKESKDIPAGYTCSVTERKTEKVDGATWTATLDHNNFKIEKNTTFAVSADNRFTDSFGKFTLKKVLDTESNATVPDGTKFNFQYSCTDSVGKPIAVPNNGKFSVAAGAPAWTSPDLPSGSICKVWETGATPALTGVVTTVKYELAGTPYNEGASTSGYQPMDYVFGASDETAGKFVIGKAGTTREITATNKLTKHMVKLQVIKQGLAKKHGDYSTDPSAYSRENFETQTYTKWENNAYVTHHYMDRKTILVKATCVGENGDPVLEKDNLVVPVNDLDAQGNLKPTLIGEVPVGSTCTVAEKDVNFNDYDAFLLGGWHHKAVFNVKDAAGNPLAPEKIYAFDMVSDNGDKAAIQFVMDTEEATATVQMDNKWDCFYSVTSDLKVEGKDSVSDPAGKGKVVDIPAGTTGQISLIDTVTFNNLPAGWYTVVERLFSKNDAGRVVNFNKGYLPKAIIDDKGSWDWYASEPFYFDGTGTVNKDLEFNVSLDTLRDHPEGISVAVMVYRDPNKLGPQVVTACNSNCNMIAAEVTLPQSQTIIPKWTPTMETLANNKATNSRVLALGADVSNQEVTDTITYSNVPAGDYYLYGRVVRADNTAVTIGENGVAQNIPLPDPEKQNVKLKPNEKRTLDHTITVDQARLVEEVQQGATEFVVFEYLLPSMVDTGALSGMTPEQLKKLSDDAYLPSHADVEAETQKLYTPSLETDATIGEVGGTKNVDPAETGTVKVVDNVSYKNLSGGAEYTVTGTLRYQGDATLADGTQVKKGDVVKGVTVQTATIDLTKQDAKKTFSGEIKMTFDVPAQALKGQTVVAFERVETNNIPVAVHEDIDDGRQTVYSPEIKTTLVDEDGDKYVTAGANAKVVDTVTYSGLDPNKSYLLKGKLNTVKDGKATGMAAEVGPIPVKAGEIWTMPFTFKAETGVSYVAFEYLYEDTNKDGKVDDGSKPVASHEDPTDPAQTVYTGKVTTDATEQGDKYVDDVTAGFTVDDFVTITGLKPNTEYDVTGELYRQGENGEEIATGVKPASGHVSNADQALLSELAVTDGVAKVTTDGNGDAYAILHFPVSPEIAATLVNQPVVVFEDVLQDGKTVAVHHDINDDKQTVYNGSMATTAVDAGDENQTMVPGQENAEIKDTVVFTGKFEREHTYTLVGELHYVTVGADGSKTDGGKVPGATAQPVTVKSDASGVIADQVMVFTVPADSIEAGKDMVVFESLHDGDADGKVVVEHRDPADPAQTVTVTPVEITTTAYDGASGDTDDKNLDSSNDKVSIFDLVDYNGLQPGNTYTVTGTLHYQADAVLADGTQVKRGDAIDAKYVTVTPVTFKANKANSTDPDAYQVIVKFEVDKAGLATAPVVVFEDLLQGETPVASHHDIDDKNQVVYNPSLETTATVGGAKLIQLQKDQTEVTVDDDVTITNAAPGTYTLKGTLMAADGKTVVATKNLENVTVAGASQVEKVQFQVPAEKIAKGAKFVVFEELVDANGETVAEHKDMLSEAQTVRVGSLDTTATDAADGDHTANNVGTVATINDRVDYSGLDLNAKYADGTPVAYLVKGELMDKATNQPAPGIAPVERVIGPAGSVYRAEGEAGRPVESVITSGTGSVTLTFEVPANLLAGKVTVVFETVYREGKEYLIHHDINDADQRVNLPKLETSARGSGELGQVLADADSTVKDSVTFHAMLTGKEYYVSGILMDKATGEPVKTAEGKTITAVSEKFTAKDAEFTMPDLMTFEVPAGTLKEGAELVVFETLWFADEVTVNTDTKTVTPKDSTFQDATGSDVTKPFEPAATHEDINDAKQTVGTGVKPGFRTILSADGARTWAENPTIPTVPTASKTLVDVVEYWGLTPSVTYRLDAKLMEIGLDGKVSAEPIAVGTATIAAPHEAAGTQNVTFTVADGALKSGYKYVAYEYLTRTDKPEDPVAPPHEDPNDPNQTVQTDNNIDLVTDLDKDGAKVFGLGQDVTLTDTITVTGTGLIPGKQYQAYSQLRYLGGPGDAPQVVSAGVSDPFTAKGGANETTKVTFNLTKEQLAIWSQQAKTRGLNQLALVAYEYLAQVDNIASVNSGDALKSPDTAVTFQEGKTWDARHEDPNDARQTVSAVETPQIATTLRYKGDANKPGADVVWEGNNVVLTDYVEYYNLEPNKEYTVAGKLMAVDANGNATESGVNATATFTTPAAEGGALRVSGTIKDGTAVQVKFTVPLSVLKANDKLVAYETLYVGATATGEPAAPPHENPNDENQTVNVKHPAVTTDASDKATGLKSIAVWEGENAAGETAPDTYTVTDRVRLYNVELGKTYGLGGQLFDQVAYQGGETNPLVKAATTVKIDAAMAKLPNETEKAKYGADVKVYETTMDFVVSRSQVVENHTLVVFEQLWAEGTYDGVTETDVTPKGGNEPVATHNDITSTAQSVAVNEFKFGSLTLTKTVTGWDSAFATVQQQNATYLFTVSCTEKGFTKTYPVKEGESVTVTGIPLGDTCTITEDVQNAVNQAGLKDTVTFTEANGVTVESAENGKGVVRIGATGTDGTTAVANVTVTANNLFTHEPVIGTDTSALDGKNATNGETITDNVSYKHMPAGDYLLHTYFVEYVSEGGQIVPKKIDWLESYASDVKVEGMGSVDGYNGAWAVNVTIPKNLVELNKKVVIWEDLYQAPAPAEREAFIASLGKLATGQTGENLVAKHHENISTLGEGYQWLNVTANFGGFQVNKIVDAAEELPANEKAGLPTTFHFKYDAVIPDGTAVKAGTALTDTFDLVWDPNDPTKAVSPKFEGFPAGTTVTITETGVDGALPTGVAMNTTWAAGEWTNAVAGNSVNIKIVAQGDLQVAATNHFTYKTPTLATVASVVGGGKMLKPSEDTPVLDTVTYTGLVEGRAYWLKTELVYTDNSAPVIGLDGQPLVRWTKVTAGADNSKWIVDEKNPLVVPATSDATRDVVFFESLFEVPEGGDTPGDGTPPVVEHRDPKDPPQIVTRRPELSMGTVATVKDATTVTSGTAATVVDTVTYNGLKAGETYTLVGRLMKKSDGTQVGATVTAAGLKASATGSGEWTMEIPLTAAETGALADGTELVVFERAYVGNLPEAGAAPAGTLTPVLSHEEIGSAPQTVVVNKPTTPPPSTPPYTPGTPGTPSTPPSTPPNPPVSPSTTTPFTPPPSTSTTPPVPPVAPATTIPPIRAKVPPTLARTGAQAAMVGALSLAMIGAGGLIGLLAARRKREAEAE